MLMQASAEEELISLQRGIEQKKLKSQSCPSCHPRSVEGFW